MKTSRCKGCDFEIVWAKTTNGRTIPLDPKPVVYKLNEDRMEVYPQPKGQFMISHFITCKDRDRFSSSSKNVSPGGTD